MAKIALDVNPKYDLVVYADASFAIGPFEQSVSGYVNYLNGVPLLWGSLKQADHGCRFFVLSRIRCC